MKCVIGLGNPGKKYALTRHNIGFMVLDYTAQEHQLTFKKDNKFKGEIVKWKDTLLLKPHTFMNLSGDSLRLLMDYFNIDIEDILVIYDDLALDVGVLRLRPQGGSGGHNGIKSIIDNLDTQVFKRLRIGIGSNPMIDGKDYVLGRFLKESQDRVETAIKTASKVVEAFVEDQTFNNIMNQYNQSNENE
ncbi:MAG: aminoacyl-tRNA hydrolase [Candidatus Izimaplasma sp.]|nr:aminoacyl-tRNA hydrolase [Candidatus Izimaplasma bacterium]